MSTVLEPISQTTAAPIMSVIITSSLSRQTLLTGKPPLPDVYYINFHKFDRTVLKILAYGIFLLDTVQTILTTWDGFHWFVYGWGDRDQLIKPAGSSIDSPLLGGIIALVVQSFFCWRIYSLGKSKVWCALLLAVSLVSSAGGVAAGVTSVILNDLTKVQKEDSIQTYIWLSGSVAADTMIAGSTLYLLLSKRKSGTAETEHVVTRIIQMTVQTNALTAAIAVLTFALFVAFPDRNYFLCPPYFFAKLYSNTLLAVFNHRIMSRNVFLDVPVYDLDNMNRSQRLSLSRNRINHERCAEAPSSMIVFKHDTIELTETRTSRSMDLGTQRIGLGELGSTGTARVDSAV